MNQTQAKQAKEIEKYKASLNEIELKALTIAEEHLESSFSIAKSIGFLKWQAEQTQAK